MKTKVYILDQVYNNETGVRERIVKTVDGYTTSREQFSAVHRGRGDWVIIHNMSGLAVCYERSQGLLMKELDRLIVEKKLLRDIVNAETVEAEEKVIRGIGIKPIWELIGGKDERS